MQVLLSIRPEHAESILSGSKGFEYRKTRFKHGVERLLLYASHPIRMVVGEVDIGDIIEAEPMALWRLTATRSGIDRDAFFAYFGSARTGFAITITRFRRYRRPKTLSDVAQVSRPPQSFQYLGND